MYFCQKSFKDWTVFWGFPAKPAHRLTSNTQASSHATAAAWLRSIGCVANQLMLEIRQSDLISHQNAKMDISAPKKFMSWKNVKIKNIKNKTDSSDTKLATAGEHD